MNPLSSEIVKNWFNEAFGKLSPELQELHLMGGVLQGEVEIVLGVGVGGLLGKRLLNKMNIPGPGIHDLTVTISHDEHCLHWDRRFNESVDIKSTFKPIGTISNGYWIEKTGPIELRLTVDIKNGGWYWRCLGIKCFGIPLPMWLFPKLDAYKYSENGGYNFYVGFTAPFVGLLFSYSGNLQKK